MSRNKLKLLVVAFLIGAALIMAGCSSTQYQEQPGRDRREPPSGEIEKGVLVPRKGEESDDMERLD